MNNLVEPPASSAGWQVPFQPELIEQLQVPDGYQVWVFAQGIDKPRVMAFGPDGTLDVTEPAGRSVVGLRGTDGDGQADESFPPRPISTTCTASRSTTGRVYLAGEKQVWRADVAADGTFTPISGRSSTTCPTATSTSVARWDWSHGTLYVSLGSASNVCVESNPAFIAHRPRSSCGPP